MANPDRNLLFPNLTTNPIYEEADHSRPNGPLPPTPNPPVLERQVPPNSPQNNSYSNETMIQFNNISNPPLNHILLPGVQMNPSPSRGTTAAGVTAERQRIKFLENRQRPFVVSHLATTLTRVQRQIAEISLNLELSDGQPSRPTTRDRNVDVENMSDLKLKISDLVGNFFDSMNNDKETTIEQKLARIITHHYGDIFSKIFSSIAIEGMTKLENKIMALADNIDSQDVSNFLFSLPYYHC